MGAQHRLLGLLQHLGRPLTCSRKGCCSNPPPASARACSNRSRPPLAASQATVELSSSLSRLSLSLCVAMAATLLGAQTIQPGLASEGRNAAHAGLPWPSIAIRIDAHAPW